MIKFWLYFEGVQVFDDLTVFKWVWKLLQDKETLENEEFEWETAEYKAEMVGC